MNSGNREIKKSRYATTGSRIVRSKSCMTDSLTTLYQMGFNKILSFCSRVGLFPILHCLPVNRGPRCGTRCYERGGSSESVPPLLIENAIRRPVFLKLPPPCMRAAHELAALVESQPLLLTLW